MVQNVGITDQVIRMLVGLVIFSLAFVGPQTVWGWLGVPIVFMAAWAWCPLYAVLGINTCGHSGRHQHA